MKKIHIEKYRVVLIIIFFVAIISIAYYNYAIDEKFSDNDQPKDGETTILIDYGTKKRMFAGGTIAGLTLLDYLDASASGNVFSEFDYQLDASGKYIQSIDGLFNNGSDWNYYVNGVRVDKPVNLVKLSAGDRVELIFE